MNMFHVREERSDNLKAESSESRSSLPGTNSQDVDRAIPSSYVHDPRWLLVERILTTSGFERSPRLSDFLRYVCKKVLEGRGDDINEQSLGEKVFGRPPGYDSGADSIVRSHALRLRHRLELYFRNEGAHETLRIEIPRGGYVPRFVTAEPVHRALDLELPGDEAKTLEKGPTGPDGRHVSERPGRRRSASVFLTGVAAGSLIVLVSLLLYRGLLPRFAGNEQAAIERQFWGDVFPSKSRTLIVPGDSGLVLYETVTGQDLSLSSYINGAYSIPSGQHLPATTPASLASDLASRRYTSIIDLDLCSRLTHLPEWSPERAAIVYARDLRPADAANSNLILIGSRQANPWVSLVEPSMNFVLTRAQDGKFYFLNRHPLADELPEYRTREDPSDLGAADVYGDIAYLPNPSGKGMVLVLSGLWMSGTQSAGEFVLDSVRFSSWLRSIASPDGTIPPFELLIRTKSLPGSADYSTIAAKRILRPY